MKIERDNKAVQFYELNPCEVFSLKRPNMGTYVKIDTNDSRALVNNLTGECANSLRLEDGTIFFCEEEDFVYPVDATLLINK